MIFIINILPVILGFISYLWLKPSWENEPLPWFKLNLISTVFAMLIGNLCYVYTHNTLPSLSITVLAWLTPTIFYTDYKFYKIPRGISRLTYVCGITLIVIYSINEQSWSPIIISAVCLLMPFFLMFSQGIGMGDIRLFVIVSLLLPWWIGMYGMIISLFIAVSLQLIIFGVSFFSHHGKTHTIKKNDGSEKSKKVLPFGPAILVGFLVISVVSMTSPVDCSSVMGCLNNNFIR